MKRRLLLGFLTLRVIEHGRLAGFDLAPACGGPRERFLSFGEGGAVRDERPFAVTAPALLKEAQKKKFALLDEIGGFELLCPDFYEALTRFFFSGTPCVGVLKALPSAEELTRRVDLPPEYLEAASELHGSDTGQRNTRCDRLPGRTPPPRRTKKGFLHPGDLYFITKR